MNKSDFKSYLTKLVKSARDKENNPTRWKVLFILEQLLNGGKNRKIVTAAITKRVRKVIGFYLPSPYRPKGFSDLKWQNKVVFTTGETTVEKVSRSEIEASEIMESLESVNFL